MSVLPSRSDSATSNTRPCWPKNLKHDSTCSPGSDWRHEVAPPD
jgi:hypothetical protein